MDADAERRPNQVHKKAIEVDAHLRVKGAPVGEIYAIGDAATVDGTLARESLGTDHPRQIETSVVSYLLELVDEADKNQDGKIDYDEWQTIGTPSPRFVPISNLRRR